MRIPVRIWATIKAMVAADSKAAAAAVVADNLNARASEELTAGTAVNSTAALPQQGSVEAQLLSSASAAGQQLHPDIMQRRMPQNYVGTGGARTTYVQVTSRAGVKQAYTLKV